MLQNQQASDQEPRSVPKNVKLQARNHYGHEYVKFLEDQQHSRFAPSRPTRRLPQVCKYQTGIQVWEKSGPLHAFFHKLGMAPRIETIHCIQPKKWQIFVAPKLEAINRSKKQVRLKGPAQYVKMVHTIGKLLSVGAGLAQIRRNSSSRTKVWQKRRKSV